MVTDMTLDEFLQIYEDPKSCAPEKLTEAQKWLERLAENPTPAAASVISHFSASLVEITGDHADSMAPGLLRDLLLVVEKMNKVSKLYFKLAEK